MMVKSRKRQHRYCLHTNGAKSLTVLANTASTVGTCPTASRRQRREAWPTAGCTCWQSAVMSTRRFFDRGAAMSSVAEAKKTRQLFLEKGDRVLLLVEEPPLLPQLAPGQLGGRGRTPQIAGAAPDRRGRTQPGPGANSQQAAWAATTVSANHRSPAQQPEKGSANTKRGTFVNMLWSSECTLRKQKDSYQSIIFHILYTKYNGFLLKMCWTMTM